MSVIAPSIFNFALVILILWYFGRKPLGAFLVLRSETIAKAILEAEQQSKESNQLLSQWETNWKASEAHAKQQLDEAKTAMVRLREATITSAKKEAERVKHETKQAGSSEITKARDSLRHELVRRSVRMAQVYLQGHLTDKDRHALVIDCVERITDATHG